jgi:hypothetical protein
MSDNIRLQKDNERLNEEVKSLKKELDRIYRVIDQYFAVDILDHINNTNSITQTANYYGLAPEWLYSKIPEWDDCNERLYGLADYKEYEYKIEGRQCELYYYDNIENETMQHKIRTPEPEEMELISYDYLCTGMSLYDIADKHNLIILNLFRLLKENRHIENETDIRGYEQFLKDYYGNYYNNDNYNYNDNDKDLKLIEKFYKLTNK